MPQWLPSSKRLTYSLHYPSFSISILVIPIRMWSKTMWRDRLHELLQKLTSLLGADFVTVLTLIIRYFPLPGTSQPQGLYEVLEYESVLEIKDKKGQSALATKCQRVRFLQNNIIAYQDQVWGDGDIFVDYRCSPGKAVDRYREGHRHHVLISLRETKQRGDEAEFYITRRIRKGFTKSTEEWQTEVNHPTTQLSVSIIFPRTRSPKRLFLIEQNSTKTFTLGPDHRHTLPDGREKVTWSTNAPRLYEAYIIRWEW